MSGSEHQPAMVSDGPATAQAALFVPSEDLSQSGTKIRGPDFNMPYELQGLLNSYATIGFQASGLTKAIEIVNRMVGRNLLLASGTQRNWRLSDEPRQEGDDTDDETRANTSCHIMLGFTSNLVSSGLREVIRFLVQHKYVSGIVTTAGGIEEDLIKCLGPTYLTPTGDFNVDGAGLRKRGLNRIGNLIVPNDNYCKFEDWVMPILDAMVEEQVKEAKVWTPSTVIARLGKEINNEESILYWAYKNEIPVFCPALTDGSFGDMLFFHSYKASTPLIIDIVQDIRRINDMSMKAPKAGMIILGGGVCKHQIANSMLFRNGADFSVYINTGNEFDGSDSGARPDEAISWGKIKANAEQVKIHADATLIFPLLVAGTWGKAHWEAQASRATTVNGQT